MGSFIAQLLYLINRHGLDQRIRAAAQLRARAELGRLSESQARAYIPWARACIEHLRDHPNMLHHPPRREDIAADGEPDIEIGSLVEASLRYGIRLLDRPRHVLAAGATGSGKTTAIRQIIEGIDRLA